MSRLPVFNFLLLFFSLLFGSGTQARVIIVTEHDHNDDDDDKLIPDELKRRHILRIASILLPPPRYMPPPGPHHRWRLDMGRFPKGCPDTKPNRNMGISNRPRRTSTGNPSAVFSRSLKSVPDSIYYFFIIQWKEYGSWVQATSWIDEARVIKIWIME
ncbi:hypothetical protein B0H14DRAFT_3707370 [Mycena olivaceomarginata]|nr:hypothetical protein B0H14DRAFT_3707370 [Mycena olivaceomarginata]